MSHIGSNGHLRGVSSIFCLLNPWTLTHTLSLSACETDPSKSFLYTYALRTPPHIGAYQTELESFVSVLKHTCLYPCYEFPLFFRYKCFFLLCTIWLPSMLLCSSHFLWDILQLTVQNFWSLLIFPLSTDYLSSILNSNLFFLRSWNYPELF